MHDRNLMSSGSPEVGYVFARGMTNACIRQGAAEKACSECGDVGARADRETLRTWRGSEDGNLGKTNTSNVSASARAAVSTNLPRPRPAASTPSAGGRTNRYVANSFHSHPQSSEKAVRPCRTYGTRWNAFYRNDMDELSGRTINCQIGFGPRNRWTTETESAPRRKRRTRRDRIEAAPFFRCPSDTHIRRPVPQSRQRFAGLALTVDPEKRGWTSAAATADLRIRL